MRSRKEKRKKKEKGDNQRKAIEKNKKRWMNKIWNENVKKIKKKESK